MYPQETDLSFAAFKQAWAAQGLSVTQLLPHLRAKPRHPHGAVESRYRYRLQLYGLSEWLLGMHCVPCVCVVRLLHH